VKWFKSGSAIPLKSFVAFLKSTFKYYNHMASMAAEYSTSMGHWRNGTDGGNRSTRKEYELHHPLVLVTNNPVHSHNT